jgi:CHAT domain-containing protein
VTAGVGRTQEWGGRVQEIKAGDSVWCPPGVKHWHGASPTTAMTHLALTGVVNNKAVEWMGKVTDAQYNAGAQPMNTTHALSAKQRGIIPIAALPDPSEMIAPLVIRHEVISLPSVSTLAALRREVKDRKPADKTVAVLADPVFETDDERVKGGSTKAAARAGENAQASARTGSSAGTRLLGLIAESTQTSPWQRIPRLPGTRQEAEQLLALVPATESKRAFDFAASRATATGVDLSQYRYLHFATHGFLNSLHPELSGIAFSMVDETGKPQDGFLRAHEVFNLRLPAELVVLSACQTGLGKEVKGEGLVGLTRGFMYAGAPRVVVSLWSVSDAATAELMTRLYRGMLKEGRRPAAALREAQISLMNNKRWGAPFYWAAFTLQGEWR